MADKNTQDIAPDTIKLSPKITAEIQRIKGELMNLQNVGVGMTNQVNSICKAVQDTLGKDGEYSLSQDSTELVEKIKEDNPKDK